jgi:class 3 adenylate cyclase/tRNA A-37 threonylcarbamoyl transferase component Bud32
MGNNTHPDDGTRPIPSLGTSPITPPALKPTNYAGTLLKDRYLIEGELGRGGIGAVYQARDTQLLQRRVVIKVLLEEQEASINNPWFQKKFEQEIEALVRIDHPGVVGVLDAGAMPDGKPFFVMQFVEGVNLRSLMEGAQLDFPRVARIVRQIGQALSAAHDKGVVHRDLKPENIMVQTPGDEEEIVKLIDFGIATVKDSQAATSVEKTKVAGALPYMAPEQLRGQPLPASDTWALAVTAYEMLTGRLPFYADTLVHLYELQRSGPGARPRQLRPDLPEAAQAALLKALAFEPRERFARAKDFGEELARALTLSGQTAPLAVETAPAQATAPLAPEMAHVLFMDLVGYSKLPLEEQARLQRQLRELVQQTAAFERVQRSNQLISLPTGDGLALVFFREPAAPVECAVELARALREHPQIKLRMGVHSGPVYRIADINASKNVAGGGINLAQRVMDCGDAGHILVSRTVAEVLSEIGHWGPHLRDLGEQEVKHGVRIHLFNLYTGEAGNPELPEKLQQRPPRAEAPSLPVDETAKERAAQPAPAGLPVKAVGAALLIIAVISAAVWYWPRRQSRPTEQAAVNVAAAPPRWLSYSIRARPNPQKYPNAQTESLPGEIIFTPGDQLRLNLVSPQEGYLYIINEGPEPVNGLPRYNVLFPAPQPESASAPSLKANQPLYLPQEEPPWFGVDEEQGTEMVWLVWSERSISELETVRKWLNATDGGEIKDAGEIRLVREFFQRHYPAARPVAEKDEQQTNLKGGKDGLLVYPVRLAHR